ncbi:MAG: lamin tail domain-containing protein [Candidatus Marinimicrobia bacterium]|nr:lamin tail domain-containing protein [Candidatus Neomarinimicrobiota bacterium]
MKRLFTMLIMISAAMTFGFGQVIDDFETDIGNWADPNFSGSTAGVLAGSSTTLSTEQAHGGSSSAKVELLDDTAVSGGYFIRMNNRVDQLAPDATIGFWIYTAALDLQFRLVIWDNGAGGDGYEAGPYWNVSAANTWEYFELDLANDAVTGWINGTSAINSTDFVTIESIQFNTTTDADAVVYIDDVAIPPPPPGLFFSQYNEGSGSNKLLEIYNPTDAVIDLTEYAFPNASNALTVAGEYEFWNTFPAGATVAPGDVYVIANGSADAAILAETDFQFNYLSNGNDGFALVKGVEGNFEIIDWLGNWDADPGTGWDVAGVPAATADHTLYRKAGTTHGNTDWAASAGTNADDSEWIVKGIDEFMGTGSFPEDFRPRVTFKVNMAHKILEGKFDPAVDYVDIAGTLNGWGPAPGEWQLEASPDTNGIWVGTFPLDPGEYKFKFRINSSWAAGYHDEIPDRDLIVGDQDMEYFGYLSNFTMYPVIFFGVDLTDQYNLGRFNPSTANVNVIGSFTGNWGYGIDLQPMSEDSLKWGAYIDEPGVFTADDNLEFKFRMNQAWDDYAESISNRTLKVTGGLQEYKAYWNNYDYNLAVTFEVNMNAKIAAGEFDPSTQIVDLAGNFNGWGGNDPAFWVLSDADADGIWSITVTDSFTVGQELEFKFRIDSNWDLAEFPGGGPNRKYIVAGGAQTYSVWWNDFDPDFVGAPVTFKVNMNAQIDAAQFTAGTDNVMLTGVFGAILMEDGDADGIYEVTANIPLGLTFYRFRINDNTPETLPTDRTIVLDTPDVPVVLEPVWFSNVEVVRSGSGNITFRVDMTVLQGLGFYDRTLGDSLQLRGGINGWGSDADRSKIDMLRQPGSEIYFLTVPFIDKPAGEVFTYKFFLNLHQIEVVIQRNGQGMISTSMNCQPVLVVVIDTSSGAA